MAMARMAKPWEEEKAEAILHDERFCGFWKVKKSFLKQSYIFLEEGKKKSKEIDLGFVIFLVNKKNYLIILSLKKES